MKFFLSVLLVAAVFVLLPHSSQAQGCSGGKSYTVKQGDTLSNIADAQKVTLPALRSANPGITDPNKIVVGQNICIPGSSTTPASPSGGGGLYSGSGSATYYYDVKTSCPQDPNGYPENDGYPTCASFTKGPDQLTLRQLGSNNVVAIDRDFLKTRRDSLCGKAITVMVNGQKVTPPDKGEFFVWDGCEACVGGVRADFSVSGARNVNPDACGRGVVPGISWKVSDTQVRKFVA